MCGCDGVWKEDVYLFLSPFPSIGSDDPPIPPYACVENVKIRENSKIIMGPPGSLRDPLQPFLGPLKKSVRRAPKRSKYSETCL